MGLIRQVWFRNMEEELALIDSHLNDFPVVSIDTEFPGFIRNSDWGASDEEFFADLRYNVNAMKLIQLGLTLSDVYGNICATWEFNFSDFDPENDIHSAKSVAFLTDHGFDFKKLRRDGIAMGDFRLKFISIFRKSRVLRWVAFHGIYDIAYLLRSIVAVDIPESMELFAKWVQRQLGNVSDLKHMARFCGGLRDGKLGLEKLAELLSVERLGNKHQAGSDSLLTASLYARMKKQFQLDSSASEGYLYGLPHKIHSATSFPFSRVKILHVVDYGLYYQPCWSYHQPCTIQFFPAVGYGLGYIS